MLKEVKNALITEDRSFLKRIARDNFFMAWTSRICCLWWYNFTRKRVHAYSFSTFFFARYCVGAILHRADEKFELYLLSNIFISPFSAFQTPAALLTSPDFRHLAQTLTLKVVESPTSILALWRLINQRRRVCLFEWLTALPVTGPRPQHWQILATALLLLTYIIPQIAGLAQAIHSIKTDPKNFTTTMPSREQLYAILPPTKKSSRRLKI